MMLYLGIVGCTLYAVLYYFLGNITASILVAIPTSIMWFICFRYPTREIKHKSGLILFLATFAVGGVNWAIDVHYSMIAAWCMVIPTVGLFSTSYRNCVYILIILLSCYTLANISEYFGYNTNHWPFPIEDSTFIILNYGSIVFIATFLFGLFSIFVARENENQINLKKLALSLKQQAQENEKMAQEMKALLQNVRQGLFYVESRYDEKAKSYLIGDTVSDFLKSITGPGKDCAGYPLADFFSKNTNMSKDKIEQINSIISISMGFSKTAFFLNSNNLPTRVHFNNQKIVDIKWSPILNENNEIFRFLVTMMDVTEHSKNLSKNELLLKKAELLSCGVHVFRNHFSSCMNLLAQCTDTTDIELILRIFHTIKGNSRTLGLSDLVETTHEAEEKLQNKIGEDRIVEFCQKIRASLENYKEITSSMENSLAQFDPTLGSRLKIIEKSLDNIAQDLDKPCPQLNIMGPVDFEVGNEVDNILNHLIKNSLVHGIESRKERVEAGKKSRGNIQIHSCLNKDSCKIVVSDDGKGLNLKALSKNCPPEASDAEIAEVIFKSGVSTTSTVNDISGRGVGMDAVKEFTEKMGGTVKLVFTRPREGDFRQFEIHLNFPRKF